MEIHLLDPTVSRLHRPNVSFIYKQLVHGITVTVTAVAEALVLRPLLEDRGRITESIRISVAPTLCPSVPPQAHTRKVEGHVPLLDIWLRRLCCRAFIDERRNLTPNFHCYNIIIYHYFGLRQPK